jgi:hypothetical protein
MKQEKEESVKRGSGKLSGRPLRKAEGRFRETIVINGEGVV